MNLQLFGYNVPLYGIFFWAGIFVAAIVAVLICKKRSVSAFDIVGSGIYTMIGAIIGAKLLYIVVSIEDILAFARANSLSFWQMLPILTKGGFVFYGGFIGGLLGLVLYIKQFKLELFRFLDIYAVVVPLGHALGRVGCFFAGCCYGIEYRGPLSYTYHASSSNTPLGIPLFPVQLAEAFFLTILFATQLLIFFKLPKIKYLNVFNYAITYSIIRFILEFFRGDAERGIFLSISTSQWISGALFVCFTILLIIYRKKGIYKN